MGWHRVVVAVLLTGLSVGGCGDDGSRAGASSDCPSVEFTSSGGMLTRVPPEPEDLATGVAQSFCAPFTLKVAGGVDITRAPVVTSEDATCIAEELIGRLGESTVRELGFIKGPWDLLGFALMNQSIERAQAEQVADSFSSCSVRWKLLLIKSVTQGADEISDESAQCVSERLSESDAREMLVSEIDRAYDDPSQPGAKPFPESVEPLTSAMDECLSATELDRLDWN